MLDVSFCIYLYSHGYKDGPAYRVARTLGHVRQDAPRDGSFDRDISGVDGSRGRLSQGPATNAERSRPEPFTAGPVSGYRLACASKDEMNLAKLSSAEGSRKRPFGPPLLSESRKQAES